MTDRIHRWMHIYYTSSFTKDWFLSFSYTEQTLTERQNDVTDANTVQLMTTNKASCEATFLRYCLLSRSLKEDRAESAEIQYPHGGCVGKPPASFSMRLPYDVRPVVLGPPYYLKDSFVARRRIRPHPPGFASQSRSCFY
jgi:hypothetical protein